MSPVEAITSSTMRVGSVEEADTAGKESGDGDFIGFIQDHRREPSQGKGLTGET